MIWKTTSSTRPVPQFGGRPIAVVRNRQARALKLSVDPASGTVRLGLPWRQALAPAFAWVETRRDWVEAQLSSLPRARPIAPGMTIPLGDASLTLDWSAEHPRRVARIGDRVVAGGPLDMLPARVLRFLRAEALAVLSADSRTLATAHGLELAGVSVGDPRRRWGSCAVDGRIRYSWRLILTPDSVRRSVVAHEVAHLREHHHGPAFHALAEELLGESHDPARRWLAANGAALHWFGREHNAHSDESRMR